MSISGVVKTVFIWPKPAGLPLSSHSSPSAMATVPVPLVNSVRRWSPAVAAHHSCVAKLQPSHSRTPTSSSSKPGVSRLSRDQPLGRVSVQTASPAKASSTLGPRGNPSKPSKKSWDPARAALTSNKALAVLGVAPPALLTATL